MDIVRDDRATVIAGHLLEFNNLLRSVGSDDECTVSDAG